MRRSSLIWAAAFAIVAPYSASANEAEIAAIKAALPTEINGWKAADHDLADVSGTPEATTVVRFYNTERGQLQVQVRLWDPAATDAEAQDMLNPSIIERDGGELVEIGGAKGSIFFGVMNLYPGLPGKGLTITIGPSQNSDELKLAAGALDIPALMAIR